MSSPLPSLPAPGSLDGPESPLGAAPRPPAIGTPGSGGRPPLRLLRGGKRDSGSLGTPRPPTIGKPASQAAAERNAVAQQKKAAEAINGGAGPRRAQRPAVPGDGLARRQPKTGAAEERRSAVQEMLGPELARWHDAMPADMQEATNSIFREYGRHVKVEDDNQRREHLRSRLADLHANRPRSPAAQRAAQRAAAARAGNAAPAANVPTEDDSFTPPGLIPGERDAQETVDATAARQRMHSQFQQLGIDATIQNLRGEK